MAGTLSTLVTGASSGIGRAVCLEYARRGAGVAAMARSEARLREVEREITAAGGRPLIVAGDVGKRADIDRGVASTVAAFGGLDILVANAGFGTLVSVEKITEEDFDAIFRTNVKGVLYAIQAALPHLRKSRGRIAIVSSILGRASLPYSSLYCMTKHALNALADSLRMEIENDGVSVTLVGPGSTKTDFQRNAIHRQELFDRSEEDLGWPPEKVARRLVRATDRRRRQIYMTFAGRSLIWARDRFPRIADWGVRQWLKSYRVGGKKP